MRLYLDNCCYNRPYDSQESFKISMETRAKLYVQDEVKAGKYELIGSYIVKRRVESGANCELISDVSPL